MFISITENENFVPEKSPENSVAFGGSHLYILLSVVFAVVFLAVLLLVGGLHLRKKRGTFFY